MIRELVVQSVGLQARSYNKHGIADNVTNRPGRDGTPQMNEGVWSVGIPCVPHMFEFVITGKVNSPKDGDCEERCSQSFEKASVSFLVADFTQ